MSVSNSPAGPTSQKRPLEEPSSPTHPSQPNAKRPALSKPAGSNSKASESGSPKQQPAKSDSKSSLSPTQSPSRSISHKDGDATNGTSTAATSTTDAQPIQSTTTNSGGHNRTGSRSKSSVNGANSVTRDEDANDIHIRAIISTEEAATIIGKGGENVSSIRRASQAKCTVSDYVRGVTDRILTVSGTVENVAKAFGLIIRTLNNEPLEDASNPNSKTYPLQLLIPHVLVGSIIGKAGVRIREIQAASTARLNVSDGLVHNSGERKLVVLGVADAVHIATYYVAKTLSEQLMTYGGPAASAYASRNGRPPATGPNRLNVAPYVPSSTGGQWGPPEAFRRQGDQNYRGMTSPTVPYHHGHASHPPVPQYQSLAPLNTNNYNSNGGGGGGGGRQSQPYSAPHSAVAPVHPPVQSPTGQGMDSAPVVQHIYIPNDMVGAIIGKGGSKINEIRQLSGSVIKINEPQDNNNERLVTISGTQYSNQMALYMLYARLENEKHRA